MIEEKKPFFYAFGVLLLLTVLYIVVGASTWAVDPIESPTRFCEEISDGLVKEPINAISNFTYIIVGLIILWNLPSQNVRGSNPMLEHGMYPILYAAGSMYIGIGSFAMHGTNTNWGTSMDWTGMLFFISFPVYYNLSRQYAWSDRFFITLFFIIFIFTAILDTFAANNNLVLIENFSDGRKLKLSQITRDYMWSLYIGTWIIQETKNLTKNRLGWMIFLPLFACVTLSVGAPSLQIIILCLMFIVIATLLHFNVGQELVRKSSPDLWIGLAFYVLGNVVWRFGREGESACNPDSLFQYHALWHLFTGLAVYYFYRYFLTENTQEEPTTE
tara:strand:- start:3174 stop:4163 length:990 start_codon:yes stop_codon:yes gene_type:complete